MRSVRGSDRALIVMLFVGAAGAEVAVTAKSLTLEKKPPPPAKSPPPAESNCSAAPDLLVDQSP